MSAMCRRTLGALFLTCLPWTASEAAAQVGLTLQWIYPVDAIYVADLTPTTGGRNPDFVSLTLIEGSGTPQNVVLEVRLERLQPLPDLVFQGTTDPFSLSGVRRITNHDFATSGQDVSLRHYQFGGNDDRIAHTSMLPSGTYLLSVEVQTPAGVMLDRRELQLQLGVPTRIEPLSPGRPTGEPPPLLMTSAPRFLWTSDQEGIPGGAQYRLRVVRADGASSGEDAMQGFAAWETVTSSTSAIYPGSAVALPLEADAVYAWQVSREIHTTAGVEVIQSPIYWFRMGGRGSQSMGPGGAQAAIQRLEALLRLLGLGEELAGYRLAGTVLVDGREVSPDGLEELLAAIAAGEVSILSLRVR